MIEQQNVEQFRDALENLRGSVCRHPERMAERVSQLTLQCRQLENEAAGTNFEPTVRSLHNMLDRLRAGACRPEPQGLYRQAS